VTYIGKHSSLLQYGLNKWGHAVTVGSLAYVQILPRVEAADCDKHSSLLWYLIKYCRKKDLLFMPQVRLTNQFWFYTGCVCAYIVRITMFFYIFEQ
jgi:hypothetical protein